MKRVTLLLTVLALAVLGGQAALTAEDVDPVMNALEACKPEIEAYCSQVTPGEGRLLACFYAHEDKLSGKCGWALYESATQLEQFAMAVTHVANACWDDLVEHCGEVEMGEGRVATCLLDHKEEVSDACSQAIDDVGLEVADD